MAWLGAGGSRRARRRTSTRVKAIYLSASLLGDRVAEVTPLWPKAYLVSPFVAPDEFDRHAARALIWLKSRAMPMPDRASGVDALFAVSLAAETLAQPRALLSREYFIEQIEHMVGRSPLATAFPVSRAGSRAAIRVARELRVEDAVRAGRRLRKSRALVRARSPTDGEGDSMIARHDGRLTWSVVTLLVAVGGVRRR